ncbi:predicted protein [Uncinocarpus reesii 1704]|uniref:Uncharacterized protein n=1 Tax=Uncinocarpus reesii (strain UAMH 1704) TaxID=336963 RepID=C4JFE3_UNCRE|nr:uncharacterized protein UREG_00957 [Uncinocarpus reesii 1704]EEP76108.1 predicted protein [Uncinocarpus reesii 1704]
MERRVSGRFQLGGKSTWVSTRARGASVGELGGREVPQVARQFGNGETAGDEYTIKKRESGSRGRQDEYWKEAYVVRPKREKSVPWAEDKGRESEAAAATGSEWKPGEDGGCFLDKVRWPAGRLRDRYSSITSTGCWTSLCDSSREERDRGRSTAGRRKSETGVRRAGGERTFEQTRDRTADGMGERRGEERRCSNAADRVCCAVEMSNKSREKVSGGDAMAVMIWLPVSHAVQTDTYESVLEMAPEAAGEQHPVRATDLARLPQMPPCLVPPGGSMELHGSPSMRIARLLEEFSLPKGYFPPSNGMG